MYGLIGKRFVDLAISFLLIVFLSPIFIAISMVIYINMGPPILFFQTRTGKNKKRFRIYKFRTMMLGDVGDSDADRITKLGNSLRRWSLDELPQLFNVLTGDMSLVGPRPLLPEYDAHYSNKQNKRFLVKPGITGLAQVSGRNDLQWDQKFSLDIEYVDNMSLLTDIAILIRTVYVVFIAKGFRKGGEDCKFNDI